jgi:hypothetical protein
VKIFFRVLLLISIVFPFYALREGMVVLGHNQWRIRPMTRADRTDKPNTWYYFGLTGVQLDDTDQFVAKAYNKSVDDGYKLGIGYTQLWVACFGLNALLFIASLLGLRLCRSSNKLTVRSSDLPPAEASRSSSP